jgi:nitrate reductase NapE component
VPVCPKCHKLVSESHYERHLRRCGTSHKHETQALYVPSATPQFESPNRGITYGPKSPSYAKKPRWLRWLVWAIVAVLLLGSFGYILSLLGIFL